MSVVLPRISGELMNILLVLLAMSFLAIVIMPVAAASVTKNVPAPPTFKSATTNKAGTVITITFSEAMARPTLNEAHQFTYRINGGHVQHFRMITRETGDNTKIDLIVSGRAIAYGEGITIEYKAGTVKAQNGGVLASFTNAGVTNNVLTPPTFKSATTNKAGTVITITFSEAMARPTRYEAYQFTYRINGGHAQHFRMITRETDDNTKIDLIVMGKPIPPGESITVDYEAGTLRAQNGGVLASFKNAMVNNAVQTPNSVPLYTVTYDGTTATDGTAPTDPKTYGSGSIVTVLGNTGNLVRDGYSFNGWNTDPDGNGISYSQDTTFIMGSTDVILYVQWTSLIYPS